MVLLYLLALLGSSGTGAGDAIRVDVIELNTCYDDRHNDCFTQLILWEYLPYLSKFGVVAWTMDSQAEMPVLKRGEHYWVTVTVNGRRMTIRADSYRETRTHACRDPERLNRLVWPERMRRGWR